MLFHWGERQGVPFAKWSCARHLLSRAYAAFSRIWRGSSSWLLVGRLTNSPSPRPHLSHDDTQTQHPPKGTSSPAYERWSAGRHLSDNRVIRRATSAGVL